jgi:protease-4
MTIETNPQEEVNAPQAALSVPAKRHPFFWGVVSGCLLLFLAGSIGASMTAWLMGRSDRSLSWSAGDRVAIVPLEGEISDSRELIDQLHRYIDNDSVKAVVLRINSPGGDIVPAQEIFEEVRRLRSESRKPIVASMDGVAASGGYYVAAACDRIIANPGTITGSIGVITQWFNVEDLLKLARVHRETITSGRMKDVGSPYRAMTLLERSYMQDIVAQLHDQFIRAVAAGRRGKMTEAEVRSIADGRVFTGETALRLHLVDEIGNLQDSVRVAARMAGMKGQPKTIYPKKERPGLLDVLASSSSTESTIQKILAARAHQFLYRW